MMYSSDSSEQASKVAFETIRSDSSQKSFGAGWLVLALILYALQVIPYLSYRWVTDESWFAGTGYSIATGQGVRNPGFGPNYLVSQFDAHPPGTALVIASAFRIFGTSEISARLGSVLAGAAIVLLVYFLGRRIIGPLGASIGALVTSTDNLLVLTSRTARPEALTAAAVMAALLAMYCYAEKGRIFYAFACGILMAAGTMFHITLAGFLLSLAVAAIAVDRKRGQHPLRGVSTFGFGYVLGLLPFAIWILTAPLGPAGFREEYLGRAGANLVSRFLIEGQRYSTLLGLNTMHGHGLESIPIRLPIPLFILAASYVLWKYRRRLFYLEVLLLVPTVLWFAYIPDKMPRYLVLLSPVLALVLGAAATAFANRPRLRNLMLIGCILTISAQFASNMLLLHQAKQANFPMFAAELRRAIPPGQTAYGTITFWMALRDRGYIAYERTTPAQAADQFNARYFITGDRVMENGLKNDEGFYVNLRREMADVVARSTLVGTISDPYYGQIKIYKLQSQ